MSSNVIKNVSAEKRPYRGIEVLAGIYTLVETAKVNGLAPIKYIKYILSDMPGSAFPEPPGGAYLRPGNF